MKTYTAFTAKHSLRRKQLRMQPTKPAPTQAIAEADGPVRIDQITPYMDLATSSVRMLLNSLDEQLSFVDREQEGQNTHVYYHLNTDAMQAKINKHHRSEQIQQSSRELRQQNNP